MLKPYRVSLHYSQESDSCQREQIGQEIEISTDNAGGGSFVIIKTDRWAIDADGIDEFAEMLRHALSLVEE